MGAAPGYWPPSMTVTGPWFMEEGGGGPWGPSAGPSGGLGAGPLSGLGCLKPGASPVGEGEEEGKEEGKVEGGQEGKVEGGEEGQVEGEGEAELALRFLEECAAAEAGAGAGRSAGGGGYRVVIAALSTPIALGLLPRPDALAQASFASWRVWMCVIVWRM